MPPFSGYTLTWCHFSEQTGHRTHCHAGMTPHSGDFPTESPRWPRVRWTFKIWVGKLNHTDTHLGGPWYRSSMDLGRWNCPIPWLLPAPFGVWPRRLGPLGDLVSSLPQPTSPTRSLVEGGPASHCKRGSLKKYQLKQVWLIVSLIPFNQLKLI